MFGVELRFWLPQPHGVRLCRFPSLILRTLEEDANLVCKVDRRPSRIPGSDSGILYRFLLEGRWQQSRKRDIDVGFQTRPEGVQPAVVYAQERRMIFHPGIEASAPERMKPCSR